MTRAGRIGLAGLCLAAIGAAAIAGIVVMGTDPAAQHRPGHVNCPPGSHGKLWSADHGRIFRSAERGRVQRPEPAADADIPMGDRALTSPHRAR